MKKTILYLQDPDYQDKAAGTVEYSASITMDRHKELHRLVLSNWFNGDPSNFNDLLDRLMKNGEVTELNISDEFI